LLLKGRGRSKALPHFKAARDQKGAAHVGPSRFRDIAERCADPVALAQGYVVKVEGA